MFALDLSGYRTTGNRPTSQNVTTLLQRESCRALHFGMDISFHQLSLSNKGRKQLVMEAALPLIIAGEICSVR